MKSKVLFFVLILVLFAGADEPTFKDQRPAPEKRCFRSEAVEKQIVDLKDKLTTVDPKLYWMFANCFPNTLDTTVRYSKKDGDDDTFVITGDIEAMLWIGILALQCIPYTASILCQIAAYQPERSKTTPEGTPPADAPAAEGTA